MNTLLRATLSAFLIVGLATGCATKALLKAANGTTREKAEGVVRVVSASRDGDMGYLCLHRTTADQRTSSYWLPIPVADTRNFYLSDTSEQSPILKIKADQAQPRPCSTQAESITVIEVGEPDRITLSPGQKEAIYVQYAEGSLANLGYVSTQAFGNSGTQHGYALDLSATDILSRQGKKRSHLLLLLPVSVVTDVATGAGYAVFGLAYLTGMACKSVPGGCKGPR